MEIKLGENWHVDPSSNPGRVLRARIAEQETWSPD